MNNRCITKLPFPFQYRKTHPCQTRRKESAPFFVKYIWGSSRNFYPGRKNLICWNGDGFLIRGQVPSLKEKDLRKTSDDRRASIWEWKLPRFRIKHKIPRGGKRHFSLFRYFFKACSLGFPSMTDGVASLWKKASLPKNFLSQIKARIRNPLNWLQWVFWHFWCQAAPINYIDIRREKPGFPEEGRSGFLSCKEGLFPFQEMEIHGKHIFSWR